MRSLLFIPLLAIALVAQSNTPKPPASSKPPGTVTDHTGAMADLIQAETQFQQAREQHGMAGWLSFFAQNAINLAPGAPITRGKPAMRKQLSASWNPDLKLTWQPEQIEVSQNGNMACTAGYWQLYDRTKSSAKPLATGKYLTVWEKEKNGKWKVVADIGNQDPAVRPSPK